MMPTHPESIYVVGSMQPAPTKHGTRVNLGSDKSARRAGIEVTRALYPQAMDEREEAGMVELRSSSMSDAKKWKMPPR
jgi:hypothetical protein